MPRLKLVLLLIVHYLILPLLHSKEIPLFTKTPLKNVTSTFRNYTLQTTCCPCNKSTESPLNKTTSVKKNSTIFRLPKTIIPTEYNLSLKIDFLKLQKDRYEEALGNISINIQVKNRTNFIILHCDENIIVKSVFVGYANDSERLKNLVKNFTHSDVLNITLNSDLKTDEIYVIDILNFTLRYFLNQETGILTRSYENTNGSMDYILATQLEPESARKLFPCFDEPNFKSIFNVIITTNVEFNILANSPEIQCVESKEWKTCSFEPTPIMSTYNLAFSINNFQYTEKIDSKNITFRIWTRPSQINNSMVSLNFTVKSFEIFEEMFKVKFPLRKVDSLAIPNLKGFLGMEHFGLITYDESILIQDERFPLIYSRQLCALIISHEVSHQWFGNIVTTAWWQNLWLNEGFATYYSFKVAGKLLENNLFYPLERLNMMNFVKRVDDFSSSPRGPMNSPVTVSAEFKFDYLSYKKGFITISLIEEIMNSTSFDLSMIYYLKTYKYNSVYPSDLWKSLNLFSKHNLEDIMKNWIGKKSYPIVKVSISKESSLILHQISSFKFEKSNISSNLKKYFTNQWDLPLFVTYGNNTFQSNVSFVIFNVTKGSLEISNLNTSNHWIIINSNHISQFTADYDETIIDRLTETLLKNHNSIPPLSRAHILQDYYDSSKKEVKNNFKRFLKLLSYIKKETHPIPLITAINLIDKLNGLFELRTFYLAWRTYVVKILKPSFLKLVKDFENNFEIQNSTDVNLRRSLLNIACKLKLNYCQTLVNPIIKRWNDNSLLKFDFDLLHIALCKYVYEDEIGESWTRLYENKMFQSWDFISVKYYAMGCSRVSWVVEKNIDIAFNVLQYLTDREKTPHVQGMIIDNSPPDHLQGVTTLTTILVLSSLYNYPNFQSLMIRFTRSGLNIISNSIVYENHFPIPKSIIEYAIPTMSHYNLMKEIYNYNSNPRTAVLLEAKSNIEWMQMTKNIETFLKKYH